MAKQDSQNTLPPLDALFHEVSALAHRLKQLAARQYHRDGLHPGAASILQLLLQHGPSTVPQIGRIRSTSRQSVQVIVNDLERNGLVELLPNPAHQRSPLVRATDQGKALLPLGATAKSIDQTRFEVAAPQLLSALLVLRSIRKSLDGAADTEIPRTPPERAQDFSGVPDTMQSILPMTLPTDLPENELPVNLL
jgi:DNA-binding MarR family transcriptional regulator